ncbi:arginase family protein [Mesorhizobium sp. SP-1A]|uniref:arginase family protein n=1 Tax=Mesorhizobium sp. SP-1A TaxID=3077840 RepID=UPI0028F6FB92|nr:arginase family protein [Mesorhizobium sp. SP-1A]
MHGTPYGPLDGDGAAESGPDAVRRAITAASVHIDHWDFDFGGPLLNGGALQAFDLGNVATAPDDGAGNRRRIEAVTRGILSAGAVPILVGGDDSVAVPFMKAFEGGESLHVLQVDAHIDWRDEIAGERFGYSSTMRRASELGCTASMTQVGIRAVGSARRQEVETALAWGSRIVTVADVRREGIVTVADTIPADLPLLIHIDCDAIDPGVCPGVNALSPGGLAFHEMTALLEAAMRKRRLAGFSIVEFQPKADVNDMSATVVGRLVCHVLGHLARQTRTA